LKLRAKRLCDKTNALHENAGFASIAIFRLNRVAAVHSLRLLFESKIKDYEHQDNADVRCQPFPE
jgi:hypothetical protein